MAEFTHALDPAVSDNVTEDLLQSNMNSRLDWLDTSEVDLTEEELVVESVVDEIIVDQEENVDYIECLNVEECVEESIVYVFDESVVEFDINEPTYIIQEDPSFLLEEEVVETIHSEDPDASDIMMNRNMEGISIRETGQLDFSDDCVELVNICSEVVNVSSSASASGSASASASASDEINKGEENVVCEINSTTVGEVNNAGIQKSQIYNFDYNTSESDCKMADFESKQSESTCRPPEIDSKISEYNMQVSQSDNNKNIGLVFNKPEISQISEFNEIQLLNSPKRVTEPSTPSFTPPNMLASILNKSNFGQMSPISPDLLSDKTSPSSTTSEITSSPTVHRTAVLGREQIKKRLQSFSLFKQGIHALPIKKVLTVKPPKVHVHTSEELDENGKKKIIIMKKPPKQGSNAQEKAKSVIDEIEQIKRDEAIAMGQQFGYNHGYLKHSLSNMHSTRVYDHLSSRKSKPSVDRDSSDRSSNSKNHDKSYRNTKRHDRDREYSRSYRHKSEEVHDKKKSEHRHKSEDDYEKKKDKDDAMQNYWNEVKKKYNEHKKLSQPKEKSVEKSTKIEELKDKYKEEDKHTEEGNLKKDDKNKKGDKYKEEGKYKKEDKHKEEVKYKKDDKYKEDDRYKKDEKHKEDDKYKKDEKYKEEDKYKRDDGFKEEERYKKEEKYREEENNKKDDKYKGEEKFKKDDKYKEDDRYKKDDRYKEDERLKKEDILKEEERYKKELKNREETKYKKEEMPVDWYDVKRKNIDFNQISKIKEKTMKISIEDTPDRFEGDGNKVVMYKREDYIKPQLIFEYPSLPRHPIVALSIAGKSKYYPPEIVRFTEKHPFLSYCEKPQYARGYYRTRKQTFNEIPHDRMDTMLQIIENKTESSYPLNSVIPDWYPAHDYLIESKLKELVVELEPKPITSYGLSVLSENYNDDEELETLVEVLLEEAIQPEKNIEEFSKSEEKELEHRSKKDKKRKKKHKKSKSRSRSKEKSEYKKSKKHDEEDEHGKSSEKPVDRSSEKLSDISSEKYRERSAEKSSERSSKKSRETSTEKSKDQSSEQFKEKFQTSRERSLEKSSEKSRGRSSEKSMEGSLEKPRELSSEKSKERLHKSREGSLEKSRERSSEKFRERSFDKSREKFPEQTREGSIEKCRERSAEKSRARSSEKSKERSQKSRERSSDKSRASSLEKSRDRSSEKFRENPSDKSTERFAEKSAGSSERNIDRSFEKTSEELEKPTKSSEKPPEKYVKQLEHFPDKEQPLEIQRLLEKPKTTFEDIFDVPTEKELLDDKTPNTDEYRSNWESDEDVLNEILREDIPYCKSYPLERKWEIEELHPRYEDKRNRRRKSSERISEERNRRRTDEKRKHRNSYEEKLPEFEHKRSNEFKQVEDKSYHPPVYNNRWSSEEDLNKLTKYDKKRYVSNEKSSKPRKSRGTDGLLKLTPSVRKTNWSSDEEFDRKNPICEFEKRNKLNFEDRKYSKRDSEPRNSFKVKPDSRWEEEHKQLTESKFRYDDLFGKDFLNLKNNDRKHKHSEERARSSDESSRKKKKDEKKKMEKDKKKKYKEKGKAPKVQINYSDLEDNLDEEFRSVEKKKNDFFKTEDKFARYKAKIKIDYSDFDMSLIESTDNYNRKFEETKAAPEGEKVEEIKKIMPKVDRVQKKIEVEKVKVPPKEATKIEVTIKEEIISPPKPITTLEPTTLELESLTPLVPPPVLPIPVPFSSVSKPETSSKLASEYEEFMKAVSFDEAPTESSKSPKDSKLGITKLELPPSTPHEESLKEDTSSDSESESSESELSESSYESSDIDLDLTLANIKTEKISDSELEAELPQSKRKRVDSDLEVFNPAINIKSEKNLFEHDDAKFNVIDWENSYTETNTYFDIFTNKKIKADITPLKNPIIDITEIIAPIVLPENIPLPSDEVIASPKESIISVTDSQNSTPIKKLRSLIPIKLLTPERRLKAIETAKLEDVIVIDEKTNQSVVSSSDGYNKDELDDLELRECRKRQSNWNLNITPSKKPLLQSSALCDDSDEDFTDKLSKSPEKNVKKLGTNVCPEVLNKEAIVIEDSPIKQLRQPAHELTKSKEGIFTEKTDFESSNFNQSGLEKPRFDKFGFECSKIEKSSVQHPENKFGLEKSISVGKIDIKKSPDRKSISRLDSKKTPVRFNRERRERSDDRKREHSRERSRDRTKRKVPDRRDRRRSRYSREREIKLRGRNSRDRSRDRAHSRENERKSKEQENKSLKLSRWDDHKQITRSPSPKMNSRSSLERIPIPARLDDTDFSATSMDIVQSPVNSPLDGFKRSLADSTISDSELITQLNTPEESNEPSPRYQQPYFSSLKKLPKTESPCSPKRISLDDRINLVLGIDKELPKQIDTVCTRGPFQHPPPNYHPDSYGYTGRSDYDMYNQPGQSDNFGTYSNQYHQQSYYPSQLNSDNNIKVVQVGNMIQVVPTEHPTPPSPVAPPVPPKVQEAQTKVVQVGNMLQIVPMTIEPHIIAPTPKPTLAPMLPVPAEKVIVSSAPSKSTETLVAERRAEKDKRRKEREQRRIEKEKKQKEKEKRKQLKIKIKTENMIKRALMLETGEGDMDISNIENEDEEKDGVLSLPWPPASSLITLPLPKPPSKGILVTHGFKKDKDDSSDEYTEVRKVKFADGICPGEGTSPSGGEELPSPPPPPRKLPKEKRYKKMKNKNKKKIKVKIIRTQQPPVEEEDESEDNLPPPPPPPGSPPPHLWPPRIKPHINNIHPSLPPNVYPPNPYPAPPPQMYPAAYNGPTQPPPIVIGHGQPPHPQQTIRHHPPAIPIIQPHGGAPPQLPLHHGLHHGAPFHH